MKLLRVRASNYKNCSDNFTIDLVAKSKKTSEDKEYELIEIANGLYTFNTVVIVGKNASGKTTAIELLEACYSLLGDFSILQDEYQYNDVQLELMIYQEGYIYKYTTVLNTIVSKRNYTNFSEQHLYRKKYYKSKLKSIYDDEGFTEITNFSKLPDDISILFFILNEKTPRSVYFNCDGEGEKTYQYMFEVMKSYKISTEILEKIIKIFDGNISELSMLDEDRYRLVYQDESQEMSADELLRMLSSGTTKGCLLYIYMAAALENGFDLLIDEVENHFHKTLVENMISLFKDKMVNRKGARLLFTTHYCELLDLFNRQDNIWITKADKKVRIENMYERYSIRPELLKSRQFYSNTFDTAVNYEDLMGLKKELMK